MEIKSVEVVRFGPLPAGFSRSFPPTGLIPLFGPNEAGKSSLLDLIRGVLYGWPQGQVTRYAAEGLGGRVVVLGPDGEQIAVERIGKQFKASDQSGTVWNEPTWLEWLGTSASVFKNIYGFGLGELERLDSLSPDALGTQLISAGLGLRGNLDQVLKGLDDKCASLFKPRGVKQPLNELQREIQSLDREIRSAETQEASYVQVVRRLQQAQEAVRREETLVTERQAAKSRLVALVKRLPRWQEYQQQIRALEELSGVDPLPEGSAERLGDVLQMIQRIQERQADRMQRWDDLQKKMPARARRRAALDPRWRGLLDEVPSMVDCQSEWADLERQAEDVDLKLKEKAKALGVSPVRLTADALAVAPLQARAEKFEQRLANLKAEWATARVRRQDLEGQRNGAREQAAELKGVPDRAEYERRKGTLEGLTATSPTAPRADAGWWIGVVVLGLAAALIPIPAVKSVLAVVVAVVGGVAVVMTRQSAGNGRVEVLKAAGFSSEAHLQAEWKHWVDMDGQVSAREKAEQLWAARQASLEEAERAEDAARQALASEEDRFQAWCREEQLPEQLSPSDVGKWLLRAESALGDAVLLRELRVKTAELRERTSGWLDRAQHLAEELGVDVRGSREVSAWQDLYEEWRAAAALEAEEEELQAAIDALREEGEQRERELKMLLADAGVPTVQDFRAREERNRTQNRLREAVASLERELRSGLEGEDWVALYESWAGRDLDIEMATAEKDVEEAGVGLRAAYAEQADLQQTKRALESQGTLPALRQRRAELFREAERMAERWTVHYVAAKVLRQAVDRFQRERQPDVMRRAGEWFRLVTGGAYTRVFATMENRSEILVETSEGRTFAPDALSRGTREQLYLALRLAWIDERASHGRTLPLILDDILVNADPGRQRRLVDLLRRFGERYQVLYLTCHPEMVDLFKKAGITTQVDMVS